MAYVIKESVLTGHRQYLETKAYKRPVKDLEAAKRIATKVQKDDNQPFVQDEKGEIVFVGKMGKDYAQDYKQTRS